MTQKTRRTRNLRLNVHRTLASVSLALYDCLIAPVSDDQVDAAIVGTSHLLHLVAALAKGARDQALELGAVCCAVRIDFVLGALHLPAHREDIVAYARQTVALPKAVCR